MLGSENLDREEILRAHREAAVKRMIQTGGAASAVQDAMRLNYSTRKKTEGAGCIGEAALGLNAHSRLAVAAEGLTLWILDQLSFNRRQAEDGSGRSAKDSRAVEEKESFRWIQSCKTSAESLPEGIKVITVCDREGAYMN
jgi:hypothetical protein